VVWVGVGSWALGAGLAGPPVYVRPQVDLVLRPAAGMVSGGAAHRRYPFGIDLAVQGWAPNVIVSQPYGSDAPWLSRFCADRHRQFNLYCFEPDPPTTKGEGRELRRLASQYGWRAIIVLDVRPPQYPAPLRLQRG